MTSLSAPLFVCKMEVRHVTEGPFPQFRGGSVGGSFTLGHDRRGFTDDRSGNQVGGTAEDFAHIFVGLSDFGSTSRRCKPCQSGEKEIARNHASGVDQS